MTIAIEVVYALPEQQMVVTLECQPPVTIAEAIHKSAILQQFPEIQLTDDMVGVFGERQPLDYRLKDQDRVEIYRPLYLSPTEARKIRAEKRRQRRKENG